MTMNAQFKSHYQTLPEYEGWTNKPTWAVKLWIDNDEASYSYWNSKAQSMLRYKDSAVYKLELCLEKFHEGGYFSKNGMYTDLLGWALAYVNWREIAEALIEDAMEAMEYQNA